MTVTAAVDASPTTYGLVELSEEDQIKQQEELIKKLEDPDTINEFIERCRNAGQNVSIINYNFGHVKAGIADLVEKYGRDFPAIESVFAPRWDAFIARWNGNTGILWDSGDLAAKTANTLIGYGRILQLVAEIATEKDLKEAQAQLGDYVERYPVEDGMAVVDGLLTFRRDMNAFWNTFTMYLEEQDKWPLTEQAKKYAADIMNCQAEVDKLNALISQTLTALACPAVFGITFVINPGCLTHYFVQSGKACKEEQDNLDKAQANLDRVKDQQNALGEILIDFEKYKIHFDDILHKLAIFAEIFNFMHAKSLEIRDRLDKGLHTVLTRQFQILIALLQAQIKPLQEGMKVYADQIHRLRLSAESSK